MEQRTIDKLRKLNIEPESELGKSLIKLDSVYAEIGSITNKIAYLKRKKQQLADDADMMEMLLMHKLNKDTRNAQVKR